MKLERSLFPASSSSSHKPASSSNKFHRAALEGYVDMLCEASRRDTNSPNQENGLTPTLLAAAGGHLDALRILVGRGGDPERTTPDGWNALHLATRRNHLNCVSFLVNFGVNMWALDNELHTAKDIAAMEQRKEILDFLDQTMAKQSALNTKQVQKLKEKAKTAAEKRLKQMRKAQLKAIKRVEKDERFLVRLSNNRKLLKAAHSISDIKLVGRPEAAANLKQSRFQMSANSASVSNLTCAISDDWPSQTNKKPFPSKNFSAASAAASDDSAYSGSSVSSASGFVHLSASSPAESRKQPKFSELTKIEDAGSKLSVSPKSAPSSTASSSIGARLRGVAGVSRKVQLKRMLLVNSGCENEPEVAPAKPVNEIVTKIEDEHENSPARLCNVQPAIKLKLQSSAEASAGASAIKWPPAPERDCTGSASPEAAGADRDESQQRLLTQCLSQLKMRHQERLGSRFPVPPTPNKQPSDELIRHRLSAADLGGGPLKPSQIRKQRYNPDKIPLPVGQMEKSGEAAKTPADSIGSAGSLVQRNSPLASSPASSEIAEPAQPNDPLQPSEQEEPVEDAGSGTGSELGRFLEAHKLTELREVFERERIDLEALVLLSEDDFKSLNILLGPRRKLAKALEGRRRNALERPMYVMVDTPL